VTSDCKPWPSGGRLAVCLDCGTVQKEVDGEWRSEIAAIYGAYASYHQSDGAEQAVFEGTNGQASRRSEKILRGLAGHATLPESGRLLDVGCGNGPMLKAFSPFAPGWRLAGSDLDRRRHDEIESIPGVEALYTEPTDEIPGTFDLITMIHVLEHIAHPQRNLASLREKLRPGGLLVAQVPNLLENPFDLLVADHASHFTPRTVSRLFRSSGYPGASVSTDWVFKELSVVARRTALSKESAGSLEPDPLEMVIGWIEWLQAVAARANECARAGRFGIFGTSIAATWLASEVPGAVRFFVDEDRHRVGRSFLGRPVFHPEDVPGGSHVFLVLTPPMAASVEQRVARAGVMYHQPPPLTAANSEPASVADARTGF
jgi:2-polyprenyl-3-methyl-5-hydroxy-6-metoxy-1,4-benzoquinol methylase